MSPSSATAAPPAGRTAPATVLPTTAASSAMTPTTAAPTRVEAPALRRLPTPCCEPPYDDEERVVASRSAPARADTVQGTLALAFVLPSGLPATPVPPRLHVVGPAPGEHGCDDEGRRLTPRVQLPDPRAWAARFVQAVVEVLAGDRPVSQLVRWTDALVLADMQRLVTVAARRCPPGRSGQPRATVRSVRVSEPGDGVAEVCALVQRGPRVTALALRLDGLDGRWRCTALEVG